MKIIKICIAILAAILMIAGFLMIVTGSLESFPTPEQIEKARISGIVLVIVGICVELPILISTSKSNNKKF